MNGTSEFDPGASLPDSGAFDPQDGLGAGSCVAEGSEGTVQLSSVRAQTCTATSYSGRSFGLRAVVGVLGLNVNANSADTGELAAAGGTKDAALASVSLLGLLSSGTVTAHTEGSAVLTSSTARVEGLNLAVLGIGVSAGVLQVASNAECGARSAGYSIAGLKVAGLPVTVTGNPNQVVTSGLLRIVINEQVATTDALEVRALHITGPGVDITVASARAGLACSCTGTPDPQVDSGSPTTPVLPIDLDGGITFDATLPPILNLDGGILDPLLDSGILDPLLDSGVVLPPIVIDAGLPPVVIPPIVIDSGLPPVVIPPVVIFDASTPPVVIDPGVPPVIVLDAGAPPVTPGTPDAGSSTGTGTGSSGGTKDAGSGAPPGSDLGSTPGNAGDPCSNANPCAPGYICKPFSTNKVN